MLFVVLACHLGCVVGVLACLCRFLLLFGVVVLRLRCLCFLSLFDVCCHASFDVVVWSLMLSLAVV